MTLQSDIHDEIKSIIELHPSLQWLFSPNDDTSYHPTTKEVRIHNKRFKIPDSYNSATFLARYYIRRVSNARVLIPPQDLEWPSPGILKSTILARLEEEHKISNFEFSDSLMSFMFGDVKEERKEDGSLITLKTHVESEAFRDGHVHFFVFQDPQTTRRDVNGMLMLLCEFERALKATSGRRWIDVKFNLSNYLGGGEQVKQHLKAFKMFPYIERIVDQTHLQRSKLYQILSNEYYKNNRHLTNGGFLRNGNVFFDALFDESRLFQLGLERLQMEPINREMYNEKRKTLIEKYDPSKPDTVYPFFESLFLDTLSLELTESSIDETKQLAKLVLDNEQCAFEIGRLLKGFKSSIAILSKAILEPLGALIHTRGTSIEPNGDIGFRCSMTEARHLTTMSIIFTPKYTNGTIVDVRAHLKMKLVTPTIDNALHMKGRAAEHERLKRAREENDKTKWPAIKSIRRDFPLIRTNNPKQIKNVEQNEPNAMSKIFNITVGDPNVLATKSPISGKSKSEDDQGSALLANKQLLTRMESMMGYFQDSSKEINEKLEVLSKNNELIQKLYSEVFQQGVTISSLKSTVAQQKKQLGEQGNIITETLNNLTKEEARVRDLESLVKKLNSENSIDD